MDAPKHIKFSKNKICFDWTYGLKDNNGQLNGFGTHAYITLAINLFYFISNLAFWLWGNIWYIDNDIITFLFEDVLLLFDVLIWFAYLPYIFISTIVQIIGIIKVKKVSILFIVNLILSIITPFIIVDAMSQCF